MFASYSISFLLLTWHLALRALDFINRLILFLLSAYLTRSSDSLTKSSAIFLSFSFFFFATLSFSVAPFFLFHWLLLSLFILQDDSCTYGKPGCNDPGVVTNFWCPFFTYNPSCALLKVTRVFFYSYCHREYLCYLKKNKLFDTCQTM